MENRKKVIIVLMLLTAFIFAVSFSTLYAQTNIAAGTACSCTLPIPVLIPTFSSLGVFIGSLVYYLMFPKIEENREKVVEDKKVLLDMLRADEREFVKEIVENDGKITQSKLSQKFGKVKTFRILESLRKRAIVEKERYGKTNVVQLSEKFRRALR